MTQLGWIDQFIRNVRPYVFVREEDSLLIRMPNQAHRINPQGARILSFLLDGGTAAGLERSLDHDPQKIADVSLFMYEVKRCLEGSLTETGHSRAVTVRPLTLGFSKLPVLSEVAITPHCNLSCVFCYYGCGSHHAAGTNAAAGTHTTGIRAAGLPPRGGAGQSSPGKRQMTETEIGLVLEKIWHEARTPSVSFTGGEPALRPELPRLVSRAKEIGLRVNLITNGTLITPELAARLAGAGLDSAQVSLEGPTAAVHEGVTRVRGSFQKSLAAVRNFSGCGITVHTNTTLNGLNVEESIDMPRFVREELGMERFSMNLVIPSGSAISGRAGASAADTGATCAADTRVASAADTGAMRPRTAEPGLLIRYSEIGATLEEIIDESERHGVEFMWYSPTPLCIFNPVTHALGNKGCSACDGLLSVDCNGDVLPCSSWSEPAGNLLESDFNGIWQSRFAESCRMKSRAHPACHACDSFAVCHGACPLYFEHFGFGELPVNEPALAANRGG